MADTVLFLQGPNGLNVPIKAVDNGDNTYSLSVDGAGGGGGGGPDRELLISYFRAKNAFTGASVGDLIRSTTVLDVSGTGPTQVGDTLWFNETTQLALASAPATADLEPALGTAGVTNAQLVAALGTQTDALAALLGATNAPVPAYETSTAGIGGLLRGIWRAIGGIDTSSPAPDENTFTGLSGLIRGMWRDWKARGNTNGSYMQGNVASDAVDAGNPVKIGGRYDASPTAVSASGDRVEMQMSQFGAAMVSPMLGGDTAADTLANTQINYLQPRTGGTGRILAGANYYFNGTSWDRTRGNTSGSFVQGPAASGATPAGNPLLQGGIYRAPASVTANQLISLMMSQWGSIMTTSLPSSTQAADALANTTVAMPMQYNGSGSTMPPAANFVYNGTTWDRARGDTNGSFAQGPVAAGAASAGNPVLMGAEYGSSAPNYGNGQRASLQVNSRGSLKVGLFDPAGQAAMTTSGSITDDVVPASGPTMDAVTYGFMHNYERNRYVRLRGTADGQQVDIAPQMKTAFIMGITATATAAIQLTTGTRRISIVARGADIRYKLGTTNAVVALNTIAAASKDPSILVLQGERVDVNVVGFTYISVIADNDSASKTGSADITEM